MSNFKYVVFDSLGNFIKGFASYNEAEAFWIGRGGAMSGWRIKERVSRY